MTVNPNPTAGEIPREQARRALAARLRDDPAFTEALIADPATVLAGVNLRALFDMPEEEDLQGYRMNNSFSYIYIPACPD